MGLTWQRDPMQVAESLKRKSDRFQDEIVEVVDEVVRFGAKVHQDAIDRVDTGRMKGAVSFETATRSGHIVTGKFGMTDDWALYMSVQEFGSERFNTTIIPMYAFTEAVPQAHEKLVELITDALKGAWN